jgi:hypothetical protein
MLSPDIPMCPLVKCIAPPSPLQLLSQVISCTKGVVTVVAHKGPEKHADAGELGITPCAAPNKAEYQHCPLSVQPF